MEKIRKLKINTKSFTIRTQYLQNFGVSVTIKMKKSDNSFKIKIHCTAVQLDDSREVLNIPKVPKMPVGRWIRLFFG